MAPVLTQTPSTAWFFCWFPEDTNKKSCCARCLSDMLVSYSSVLFIWFLLPNQRPVLMSWSCQGWCFQDSAELANVKACSLMSVTFNLIQTSNYSIVSNNLFFQDNCWGNRIEQRVDEHQENIKHMVIILDCCRASDSWLLDTIRNSHGNRSRCQPHKGMLQCLPITQGING